MLTTAAGNTPDSLKNRAAGSSRKGVGRKAWEGGAQSTQHATQRRHGRRRRRKGNKKTKNELQTRTTNVPR